MQLTGNDLALICIAVIFPPVAVAIQRGCTGDVLINILLTLLFHWPGVVHAMYLIVKDRDNEEEWNRLYPQPPQEKGYVDMHQAPVAESQQTTPVEDIGALPYSARDIGGENVQPQQQYTQPQEHKQQLFSQPQQQFNPSQQYGQPQQPLGQSQQQYPARRQLHIKPPQQRSEFQLVNEKVPPQEQFNQPQQQLIQIEQRYNPAEDVIQSPPTRKNTHRKPPPPYQDGN